MKKNPGLYVALLFIVIAIFFYIATYSIPVAEIQGSRLGPRFFPRVVIIAFILLNLILAYQTYRYPEEQKDVKKIPDDKRKRFGQIIMISILFGVFFTYLGGFLAIFLFVLSYLWVWKKRDILTLILTPSLVTLGIYLVFYKLLSVRLPKGIFYHLF